LTRWDSATAHTTDPNEGKTVEGRGTNTEMLASSLTWNNVGAIITAYLQTAAVVLGYS
jgi:hypothetical protein